MLSYLLLQHHILFGGIKIKNNYIYKRDEFGQDFHLTPESAVEK